MKIVAISDIHNHQSKIELPNLDPSNEAVVLVIAGDFTNSSGRGVDLYSFDNWLAQIKHRFTKIIVVLGNHEYSCYMHNINLTNAITLNGEYLKIENTVFYGSTYSDNFGVKEIRNNILFPKIDVLVTHYPPYGILDKWGTNNRGGSQKLLKDLTTLPAELRPKYHLFGHIHGFGHKRVNRYGIEFINLAMCDDDYRLIKYNPIVLEV